MTQAEFLNRLKNAYYEYLDYEAILLQLSNIHAEKANHYYEMGDGEYDDVALLHENISIKLIEGIN